MGVEVTVTIRYLTVCDRIKSSLIEIKTIKKNILILYYGFFKYGRVNTNI